MNSTGPITTSEATTQGIRVTVRAQYSPEHSAPRRGLWFFVYTIRIVNGADRPAKLLNRRWEIQAATGKTETVEGPGVVGVQPHLEPGQSFEYSSGCPLPCPRGTMSGSYEMVDDDGEHFDVEVATFDLYQPDSVH